ncbi:MAG: hypothetical protein ACFFEN_10975 [Candidatus Thorarchaeota archaeon]
MYKEIIQFYRIGKELGLSRRDINKILFTGSNNRHSLRLSLIIFAIIASILIGVLIIISGLSISRNTYPTGARYSTIKGMDFKHNKKN